MRKWKSLSCIWLFVTSWTAQSMEFSRPEYWSGQPFPSPGDLPNPGIESRSPTLQADSLPAEPQGKPKNTGVDSLSLLQRIFLTQKLNRGLLALQADSLPPELHRNPTRCEGACNYITCSHFLCYRFILFFHMFQMQSILLLFILDKINCILEWFLTKEKLFYI